MDIEKQIPKEYESQRTLKTVTKNLKEQSKCLKPVDWWALGYLVLTFPLMFVGADPYSYLWGGALMRLVLIPGVFYFRQFCADKKCPKEVDLHWIFPWLGKSLQAPIILLHMLLDGYVPALFVLLYSETGQIIPNIHGAVRYDADMQRYEQYLFLAQPAIELREWYPSRVLGEYLHFCYFNFYVVIVGVLAMIYFFRPREFYDRAVSALALTFFSCFLFYIVYPVEGPYWSFPRPEAEEISFYFGYIVRWVLVASAHGTAMPSSHCAISTACWVSAW
eukprot:CAMPEP_0174254420 /NCGR_PEP_ID=MMETSP0439-20130205/3741_1 /TAXON_ID=0 /ORGANISM="Stereomyxa ramosa, Strain Chinc5" /LENGTH=276 /DNA_ID=CAMNT_0015335985 /DNA_START=90 /DNA_END=917 /DNA_ORIENTATION=+